MQETTTDADQDNASHVPDNPFAFSSGQLSKLVSPKSARTLIAYGGLSGLEKGLRTDKLAGLSIDETHLGGSIAFQDAIAASTTTDIKHHDESLIQKLKHSETRVNITHILPQHESDQHFVDRRRVFGENRLPQRKSKSFLQLAWIALQDRVLILLSVAAAVSLALGLYQTFSGHRSHETDGHGGAKVEWVEGLAIIVAILIVVLVGALNDWQKERQFRALNRKKQDRLVKVVRSGRPGKISIYDVLVGDVMLLEQGDILPVDGVLIEGHNISCDEASATGESDIVRKVAAGKHLYPDSDPFLLSGTKVLEGVGSFLITAVGPNSSHGQTMLALRDDPGMTPLQIKLNIMAGYIAKLGSAAGLLLFTVLFIEYLVRLRWNTGSPEEKAQQFLRILVTAITIIVVAVPEGLPLAVTLSLAFATKRMTKENNLVRHLQSCETMGNATVICSDKTGTLTENVMTVVAGTLGAGNARFDDRPHTTIAADETVAKSEAPTSIALASTINPEFRDLIRQSIAINSTAFEGEEKGQQVFIGTKTETALLDWARNVFALGPLAEERANQGPIVHLFPFNSQQKCMGVVIRLPPSRGSEKSHSKYRLLVKGAAEIVLGQCAWVVSDPTTHEETLETLELEIQRRHALTKAISGYASQSLRTLALAYRDFDHWPPRQPAASDPETSIEKEEIAEEVNTDSPSGSDSKSNPKPGKSSSKPPSVPFESVLSSLTALSILAIQDPVRRGVPAAVARCHGASVQVKMVTGDNMETARAIALECGILPHDPPGGSLPEYTILDGPTFRSLPPSFLPLAAKSLLVLARSSPTDKQLLVQTLRGADQIVAVTGDGTNDAPALKAADVGFSMGITGTEVAKEASDIILMDDDFASIVKALAWGRAINDSVKKFLQFQLTVNVTAVALTFVSAVSSDDERSVLNAIQLLWVNLIMDTFAALALATDPPTESLLEREPERRKTAGSLVSLTMWKMIMGQAVYQLGVGLGLYFAGEAGKGGRLLGVGPEYGVAERRTLVFNVFVFMQIFKLVNSRRIDNRLNIFEGLHRNRLFMLMMGIMVAGQAIIIEFAGQAFDVVPLDGTQWGVSIVLGFLSIPVGVLIRLVPDGWVRVAYVTVVGRPLRWLWRGLKKAGGWLLFWRRRRGGGNFGDEERQDVDVEGQLARNSSVDGARSLQETLASLADELAFLKAVRGGRIRALGETLCGGKNDQGVGCAAIRRLGSTRSTRSRTEKPVQSALGVPGLLAASIGALGLAPSTGCSNKPPAKGFDVGKEHL